MSSLQNTPNRIQSFCKFLLIGTADHSNLRMTNSAVNVLTPSNQIELRVTNIALNSSYLLTNQV